MSYIGNSPITSAFLVDTFSGTGSQTAFTMTVAPANTSSIIVAITGVLQDPSTYSVSGTTLTFSTAPPSGTSNISVRYLGIPASGVTTTAYRTVTNTTATSGQTSFTIPSYTVGYVDVYRNGVYLPTTDYTATTGTTVVLGTGATTGDTITTISFYVSSVLNAVLGTNGSSTGQTLISPNITTSLTLASASGTSGQLLTSGGSGAAPTWTTVTGSQWTTSGSNIYYSTGKVGIGTSSPSSALHISGSALSDLSDIKLQNTASGGGTWRIGDGVGGNAGSLSIYDSTAGATRMMISSNGYFQTGLGSSSPYNATTASAANVNIYSDGALYRSTSALKYKKDIRDLESIDINKFRPIRYKSKCANDDQTLDHFGIVADEVDLAGIKELVNYGADGEVEGFQYERLTVVLLKAVQELKAELATLRGQA